MLTQNEPLYPKNGTCKLCINKPCRELFKGRVFPGKMIFVHHGQFQSWPCHTPNLKPAEEETEEAALTDDLVVTTGKVTVTNPRWEHVDEDRKDSSPATATVGDVVKLSVDVTGIPEGAPVTFDIFDVSADPPLRIATAKGKNEQGTASGEWEIEDPNEQGEELKLEFEGIAKSKASSRKEIPLKEVFIIHLQIDVDDPAAKDDTLILQDESGAEVMKLAIGEMKEVSEDVVCLSFEELDMDKKYSLIRDYGPDEEGGIDPLFVDMTPNEIRELFKS